jgi:hypothetical protein
MAASNGGEVGLAMVKDVRQGLVAVSTYWGVPLGLVGYVIGVLASG